MIACRARVSVLVFCVVCLLACVNPASADCEPIDGIHALLAPGRVLLLGELHGTVESPAFTGDVACHAAGAGLDVVVALELSPAAKSGIETFFLSQGKAPDRKDLLSGSLWQQSYQDGRTSRAMADLLVVLARLRREGRSVRLALFDAQPAGGGQARERAMAANLASSVEASPEAMHIVLTGNLHSRITKGNRRSPDYEPMGYLLSQTIGVERLTSLNVSHAGGSAWICAPDCGEARIGGRGSERRWTIEIDEATRPAGHHGWYGVGTLAASPPAVGEHVPVVSPTDPSTATPPPEPAVSFPVQTAEILQPFQGSWQAYQHGSKAWTIDIKEQRFRGLLGPDDWYEGQIRLRPDTVPGQIDFMIENCRCNYRGMTSQGIFRLDGESIVLAAPTPGSSRPDAFNPNDGRMVELKRIQTKKPE
jgi:uncharacterized protein (TIGR03067 family)